VEYYSSYGGDVIKLYIDDSNSCNTGGIKAVVDAQKKYLKDSVQFARSAKTADVIACHNITDVPVDVLHLHNFYFYDLPGKYSAAHGNINRRMLESIRLARYVTVPSEFIAYPLRRDLRIEPIIIPHGIDVENWDASKEKKPCILWNKNRATDVCDTTPIEYLTEVGLDTISTFGKAAQVTGVLSHVEMQKLIEEAGIYLATAPESFGIGVLEALAAGVPVLAYDWGNVPNIVRQGVEGFLVEPGDLAGLVAGCKYIFDNHAELAANARERAAEFSWDKPIQQYLELYELASEPYSESVSIVIEKVSKKGKLPEFKKEYEVIRTDNVADGVSNASGDYIAVIQESDRIDTDEFEQLLDAVADRKFDLVFPLEHSPLTNIELLTTSELGIGIPKLAVFRRELVDRAGGVRSSIPDFYAKALSFGLLSGGIELRRSTVSKDYTSPALDWLPWVQDKNYPVGFLSKEPVMLCSYTNPVVTVLISDICDAVIMTLESLYIQRVPIEVILTSDYDVEVYKDFVKVDANPVVRSKYVMHLNAGDVLHPTALLEMLLEIEDYQYICTDSRKAISGKRIQNGRKLLERVEGGKDWLYYPEVCWYTDAIMPCGSCGERSRRKVYSSTAKTLRCIVPKVTNYIGRKRYRAVYGEELIVSPEDVAVLLETGAWEEVKPVSRAHTEPRNMIRS
jgi:hypothetical protein